MLWGTRAAATAPVRVDDLYIPPRFEEAIAAHLAENRLYPETAPLILAIIGGTGTGKSWQSRATAARRGWGIEELHSSALSGPQEGVVISVLHAAYGRAMDARDEAGEGFLLLDDFDLSLVSIRKNVETSQHTQLLTSAFMELCDRPKPIVDKFSNRTPVVVTTNSVDAIYGPLLRYGRMHIFHWRPSIDEVSGAIAKIMEDFPDDIRKEAARRFAPHGVAFASELRSELHKLALIKLIRIANFDFGKLRRNDVAETLKTVTIDLVEDVASQILRGREQKSYLVETSL
jgi:ATPase family associated with various cellular activities (AAA)